VRFNLRRRRRLNLTLSPKAFSKLTLSIDAEVVAKAKKYAASEGRSLSSLIEAYLLALTTDEPRERRTVDA